MHRFFLLLLGVCLFNHTTKSQLKGRAKLNTELTLPYQAILEQTQKPRLQFEVVCVQ